MPSIDCPSWHSSNMFYARNEKKSSFQFMTPPYDFTDITDLTEASEHCALLCQLMVTVCVDLFRDVVEYYTQPTELRTELRGLTEDLNFNINGRQKIMIDMYKRGTVQTLNMDLPLLYILIRFICNIPSKSGWGNCPEDDDKSLSGCIERIRLIGKSIMDHLEESGEINEHDFESILTNLRTNLYEIQKVVSTKDDYVQAVDELLSFDLKSSNRRRYIRAFKSLKGKIDSELYFISLQSNLDVYVLFKNNVTCFNESVYV